MKAVSWSLAGQLVEGDRVPTYATGQPLAIEQSDVDALYDRYQNVYGQLPDRSTAQESAR